MMGRVGLGWNTKVEMGQGIEMMEIKEVVDLSCVLMNSELCC